MGVGRRRPGRARPCLSGSKGADRVQEVERGAGEERGALRDVLDKCAVGGDAYECQIAAA
jgi:hypothetical protein